MPETELHPRPQLTREHWTDLCGPWQFAYDDADSGLREGWVDRADPFDRTITVPFPPESRASGIGDPSFHPVVWYRRTFQDARADAGQRLLLHFGAVDYAARVWVNGQLVARHQGGHTPFSADVTAALQLRDNTGEQIVVVRAEDWPTDLAQPRGKQDWEATPHRIWYDRTTGIWQPVWLEPVPDFAIAEVRWTPDLDRALLGFEVRLSGQPSHPLRLSIRLSLRGESMVDDAWAIDGDAVRGAIALDPGDLVMRREQVLWSPQYPNLLDAELRLLDGDQVVDKVQSYVGLRSAGVSGGRFLLNGRPHYLRLVLEQGFWPESHLAAPSAEALRHEVELVKSLGFNGARIHQKVEDPRFLYWCDKLGLLVWGEMANAYVFSPLAVDRLTREWLDVLRRDYNHPCIVTWVPFNESWGVPNLPRDPAQRASVAALYHLTRSLDPTRPVIGNDGWEHVATDIVSIHDYASDGAALRERYGTPEAVEWMLRDGRPAHRPILLPDCPRGDEPVMLTEFGGIAETPKPGEPTFYGTVEGREAFLAKYEELVGAVLDCPPIAGFCYTQLTDTMQERNGLLTEDRTPKLDPAAIAAITSRPSRANPAEAVGKTPAAPPGSLADRTKDGPR